MLVLAACTTACSASTAPAVGTNADARILFIGNSLTYTNDLPGMVAEIGRANGVTIAVASATIGGTALVDHLTTGSALSEIAKGGWTAVVMQQGPTPAGICRDTLVLATVAFAQRIRAVGATPATLMTWPAASRLADFPQVHESALVASSTVNGLFLPAGDAWQSAWRLASALELYGADGFHPAPLGSYLAALVVFEGVTGRDARQLVPTYRIDGRTQVPADVVRVLQRAAHEALSANGAVVPRAEQRLEPRVVRAVRSSPFPFVQSSPFGAITC